MGTCCGSKPIDQSQAPRSYQSVYTQGSNDSGYRLGGNEPRRPSEPTSEEKRSKMLAAAEKRQDNWRQGGGGDDVTTRVRYLHSTCFISLSFV